MAEITKKELTKKLKADCNRCSGKGWVSAYHDETEDCPRCNGSGHQYKTVPIPFEELLSLADKRVENLRASDIIRLIAMYDLWRNKQ